MNAVVGAGRIPAASCTVDRDTQLIATMPAGATSGSVAATASGSTATSAASFSATLAAPKLTKVRRLKGTSISIRHAATGSYSQIRPPRTSMRRTFGMSGTNSRSATPAGVRR